MTEKHRMALSGKVAITIVHYSLLLGCSAPVLKPISYENRIEICLVNLIDLTGGFSQYATAFDSLCHIELNKDFVETIDIRFHEPQVRLYPNPFKASVNCLSSRRFLLNGDVERISYEPSVDIHATLVNLYFSGIPLPLPKEDFMGAFVQLRFYVSNPEGEAIDTFVVVGASYGDRIKYSRRLLMDEAIQSASCNFLISIFTTLKKRFSWELPTRLGASQMRRRLCLPPER